MSYMLDTNTCIYLIAGQQPQYQARILERLERLAPDENLLLSSVVVFELSYGAQKGRWRKANLALLEEFLLDFVIVPFDMEAAHRAGSIRSKLEQQGRPIGPMDTLIAAHAASLNIPLVTHNVAEFARVAELQIEDWTQEAV